MNPKLNILVVDDSTVARRLVSDALVGDADMNVTTAVSGRIALTKIAQTAFDCVTLDIEMPDLDGLATLREIRKTHPRLPVIMFSSLTHRGATATLDALAAGANDYVAKPSAKDAAAAVAYVRTELLPKVKALCGRLKPAIGSPAVTPAVVAQSAKLPSPQSEPIDVIAIGISTGGPNALSAMMPMLPADLPVPILIVQHMPPVFTKLLADRLSAACKFPVVEAAGGMPLRAGTAYIAPGGRHLVVERRGTQVMTALNDEPPENSCRPAVDVLFRSVHRVFGRRTLAVIMTGMGSDGLLACRDLRVSGATILAQDEATSVVWGMPGFVARAGLAEKLLPLDRIAAEIEHRVVAGRRTAA